MKNLLIIYSNTPQYILINNKKQLEKIARKLLKERIEEGWFEDNDGLRPYTIQAESALRLNRCWQFLQKHFSPYGIDDDFLYGSGALELVPLKESY